MSEPKLSIITINFNDVNGLQKTMNSVFEQTFTDFEYIIIDGGSDDGSLDLIKENKERIAQWVSEDDSGIYNAMNKGIRTATGEYLLFLNSGDTLTESRSLEEFIGHPAFEGDIIYGDYKFKDGEKIYPEHLTPLFFMRSSLPHQSTLFKRNIFLEMGLYDESYQVVADRLFYLRCLLKDKYKFKHIQYFLSKFDLTGISHNQKYIEKKKIEDERMFKDQFGLYYEDYKNHLALEQELYRTRRNTFTGIMKRIKRRLSLK
jgi:glycosyltransferase involved in cell wall biosynthesis